MILVANDIGSKELAPQLSKRVPCQVTELAFGDFVFVGAGPDSSTIPVVFERKTWPDLIASLESGRLETHQVPGIHTDYPGGRYYLLVEGQVKRTYGGIIERFDPKRKCWTGLWSGQQWSWERLQKKLCSIEELGGLQVIYTQSEAETCDVLKVRYEWWSKPYEAHRSFKRIKQPAKGRGAGDGLDERQVVDFSVRQFEKVSYFRSAIAAMKGVGWELSGRIDKRFPSMLEACLAPEKAWKEVEGIGKVMAGRIYRTLRGEEGE